MQNEGGVLSRGKNRRATQSDGKRDLVSPHTVIIHVGANDLRTTRNLDFVTGEGYAFVCTAKKKIPNCRLILSGVLRRRDVSWRRIGALPGVVVY